VAVYAIDVPYPIVAVAGVVRPAVFIAERLLAECSSGEVRAMIGHETSHIRTFDNARRFVLCACPDLFGDRSRLTRAWKDAAEEAADEDVARTPAHALDLAQALIRVARLAPACAPALASAFYAGAGIDGRVRRLVTRPVYDAVPVVLRGWALGIAAAVLAAAFVLSAPVIHQLMEAAVRLVP
jgi:beta-lactamase regulating signal transducer with metallopeptidase domain